MFNLIRVPLQDIVDKIHEKTGLSDYEIMQKVEDKQKQLSGLISKDGAAHIIANELGVKLIEHGARLKIKSIYAEMRSIETVGKVTNIFEPREFVRADNTTGKVASMTIGDETGLIRVVGWGSNADRMHSIKTGDIVKIISGYVRENRGFKEIHLNDNARIVINPEGETVGEVKQREAAIRKKVNALVDGELNVEILGTIVQVFDLKFFEVCPDCGKRLRQDTDGWYCGVHKKVEPAYSYVMNVVLDDGTGNMRVVFFRNQVDRLLSKSQEQVMAYRINPEPFEETKSSLLGEMFRIVGRTKRNDFFDRVEFTAQLVFPASVADAASETKEESVATQQQPLQGPTPEKIEFSDASSLKEGEGSDSGKMPESAKSGEDDHWSLDNQPQSI